MVAVWCPRARACHRYHSDSRVANAVAILYARHMAKSGMESFGRGSEVRERSPSSIEGLVESGFIDESGQLTKRTRRAIPRGGVEILTPIKVLEDGELVDPKLSREVQDSCFVIADGVIVGGCFLDLPGSEMVEYNGRISSQGFVTICQDPMLVNIVEQLEDIAREDRHTRLTLRDMGALGFGGFVAGGGMSWLGSGEPFLTTAGTVVGGAVGSIGFRLTERKWLEGQVEQLSRVIHERPDNITINLDLIDKARASKPSPVVSSLQWFWETSRVDPNFRFDAQIITINNIIRFIFRDPRYNSDALMFAKKCQECQQEYDAIQREQAALEVRTSMGIKTNDGQLDARESHTDEYLADCFLQLFDGVKETHDRLEREEQQRQSRREFDATIERLTTVTEEEIKCQSAKVFHDELMRSLSGETLIGFSGGEQGVYTPAIIWAMDFIHKLPQMITPSLSIHEAYDYFQGEIKDMTDGKLTLPTTEEFQQKYPVIDQGIV